MGTREQLLQTLMSDLADAKLPERYSAEKQAEIMAKRKGQQSIDEGRRQIEANEKAYQTAVDKRADLQRRIGELEERIQTSNRQEAQESPTNQAIQYGKSLGIPAAGYAAGHVAGAKFGASYDTPPKEVAGNVSRLSKQLRGIDKTAPASKAQASAIVDTYDKARKARPLSQFVGPAALAGMSVATQAGAGYVDDPTLKEGLNLAANAERYGAGGMALQQLFDTLRHSGQVAKEVDPTDVSSIESARRQINAGGKFDKVQGAMAEAPPPAPPEAPPAAKPAPKPGTVKALRAELKARDVPGAYKMNKGELEKALAKALRQSSKAIVPLSVGAGVYDSLRSPAEASGDADPAAEPMARAPAAAAGAGAAVGTAGAIEGGRRLASRAMGVPGLGAALRGLGRVAGPAAGALTAYDAGSAILGGLAQGEDVAGADAELRQGNPQFAAGQEELRRQAYGEAPPPTVEEAEFAPIAEAAEADPELAALLHEIVSGRLAELENHDPMSTALASQSVASGGNPFAAALRNLAR